MRFSGATSLVWLALLVLVCFLSTTSTSWAFEWHAPGQRPEVTRQAIAGLWKLTPSLRPKYPMKEFTVYPKKNKKEDDDQPELLLMLKEDGSFQEYASDEEELENEGIDVNVEDSWKRFREKQKQDERKAELAALAKGTWDYRDGKLILAADRPSTKKQHQDTLLEGRVVATYETSLPDNPVLETNTTAVTNDNNNQGTVITGKSSTKASPEPTNSATGKRWDAHLAVPKGSVKVGKFFYPKHHPSFFDQPIYNPAKRGAFQLRQILGSLNTNLPDEDAFIEKFQRADFYNKTFLLTSHPLQQRGPKGNVRWSNRQGKFIEEPPTNKAAAKYAQDMESNSVNIRVMQVRFFPNNTFATIWGTGDAILRGKFDIVGQDSDQLWMHISRFGFGRSVSGSVFSEGRMLSQDDAKSYWGYIKFESSSQEEDKGKSGGDENGEVFAKIKSQKEGIGNNEEKKLEVEGSVQFGAGLEPMPVGRFIMRETDESFDSLFDDEDDDEEEEEEDEQDDISGVQLPEISASLPNMKGDDGVDLSSDDAFQ